MNAERTSVVSENPLLLCAPMPHHHRAVLGAGHHVAVLTHVALGPSNARHYVVMAEYRLHHVTCRQHRHPTSTQPCIPPGVAKSSISFGWGKGGNVASAGWQVTLCDLIWHVSSWQCYIEYCSTPCLTASFYGQNE